MATSGIPSFDRQVHQCPDLVELRFRVDLALEAHQQGKRVQVGRAESAVAAPGFDGRYQMPERIVVLA